jgi:hypothetical protein
MNVAHVLFSRILASLPCYVPSLREGDAHELLSSNLSHERRSCYILTSLPCSVPSLREGDAHETLPSDLTHECHSCRDLFCDNSHVDQSGPDLAVLRVRPQGGQR